MDQLFDPDVPDDVTVRVKRDPAPLSTDSIACRIRNAVNFSVPISKEAALNDTAGRPVRVLCDGIYDLFHYGHARQLEQAKNVFPNVYLIVAIVNDEVCHEKKGKTVMNDRERIMAIRHCRYVDEVIIDQPWFLSDDFLTYHKIDFVAHDDLPYVSGSIDLFAHIKAQDKFVATSRTPGISTSDLIARIVKDYDQYARRNLSRGYTHEELNLSFFNQNRLKIRNQMARVGRRSREIVDSSVDLLRRWEANSRHYMSTFLGSFGTAENLMLTSDGIDRLGVARAPSLTPPSSPTPWEDEEPASKVAKTSESRMRASLNLVEVPDKIREDALEKVRTFLWGSWKKVPNEDIIITRIKGGLSNYHFKVALSPSVKLLKKEPRAVLYRLYGEILMDNAGGVVIDTVVFALLSEKKFGPRLYGIFRVGRIEHFIENARSLTCKEIAIPTIARTVAVQFAKFHVMDLPLRRMPTFMTSLAMKWLREIKQQFIQLPTFPINIYDEWEELSRIIDSVPPKIVLCHNDLQEGNILIIEKDPKKRLLNNIDVEQEEDETVKDKIHMIDFEYAAYNHRGFDLAHYFTEYCYDYSVTKFPCFERRLDAYPSKAFQLDFFRAYLKVFRKECPDSHSLLLEEDDEIEIEALYKETNIFALFAHYVWALWSLRQASLSQINFGFNEYAVSRIEHYLIHKKWLQEENMI